MVSVTIFRRKPMNALQRILLASILALLLLPASSAFAQEDASGPDRFTPDWESLNARKAPSWFADAKLRDLHPLGRLLGAFLLRHEHLLGMVPLVAQDERPQGARAPLPRGELRKEFPVPPVRARFSGRALRARGLGEALQAGRRPVRGAHVEAPRRILSLAQQ